MSSSVDETVRQLLAAAPGDFVAARASAVRQLKADGHAAAAAEVAKLRKPPLKLWAANRAAVSRADAAWHLAGATGQLREVERRVAAGEKSLGTDLREAAAEQRRQLDVLESEARRLLDEVGSAPDAAAEAREILRIAVRTGGAAWDSLVRGALLDEPAGEEESVFAVAAADLPVRAPAAARDAESRRAEVAAAAQAARAEAITLDREARELEDQARAARRRADGAAAKADAAEAALRD